MNGTELAVMLYHYIKTRFARYPADRAGFERWQERQVLRRLRYVQRHSPFYRELWAGRPLADWRQFPIIDKSVMMRHFDRLNTAGVRKDEAMAVALEAESARCFRPRIGSITVGLSSGTSGNRGLFLVSDRERAAWAGTMLGKLLPGPLWKAEKVAFFLRANSNLYETVRHGKLQFEYFDLLEPFERHVERLESYRPGILIAPPSMLRLLAEAKRERRLNAAPHRIVSVAEVLDPLDAHFIQEVFGPILHQVYQCTEGFLASTCRCGTLHLNEDIVCIEKEAVPGERRKFVPIITDFSRATQPIVRYRLNDLLTEAETPCRCGSVFTAIERIEGRCDDVFYLPRETGGGLVPVFPDLVTRAIITASPVIEEYRAVQQAPERIGIALQTESGANRPEVERQVKESIARLCRRLECKQPDISFAEYSFTPGDRKLRRVERSCPLERSFLLV